jgi:hypothetical protein
VGRDFRVPIGQGQSFPGSSTSRFKSRFLYFPEENHWVLKPQNTLVWQTEFSNGLKPYKIIAQVKPHLTGGFFLKQFLNILIILTIKVSCNL